MTLTETLVAALLVLGSFAILRAVILADLAGPASPARPAAQRTDEDLRRAA